MLGCGTCYNEGDISMCNYSPRVSIILRFELIMVHTCYFLFACDPCSFFLLHAMLVARERRLVSNI